MGPAMEFGHLDDVSGVDLSLPADDPITREVLAREGAPDCDVRSGLPVWSRRDWVGPLYPPGTAAADHLRAFGRLFETVEVNSTFYHPVAPALVARWCEDVPARFRFCPKVSRALSHEAPLRAADVDAFLASALAFGPHLGPCFLQLPPHADLAWRRPLAELVRVLCAAVPLAVELRHAGWFAAPTRARLFGWLAEREVGLVITDTPAFRGLVHMGVTAPFTLVRFRGARLDPSDVARASAWGDRLGAWARRGLREAYFVTHTAPGVELEGLPPLAALAGRLEGVPGVRIAPAPSPPRGRQLALL
jgi:uncharacterized protein YecE (DUF72 family)